MQTNWAQALMHYYNNLQPPVPLPNGISWLQPQQSPEVQQVMQEFFQKFFDDKEERTLMLGINPGRFGAGVTGVNFTAAKQLTEACGIKHSFPAQSELSAEFIYEMIAACGGPEAFYKKIFIGSVCPLGFVQGGKNLNYYDDKVLLQTVLPFIIKSMNSLLQYNINRQRCICIGGEKNFKHLAALNKEYHWFEELIPVPHPRFVQQYRRKQKPAYIDLYLQALFAGTAF